MDENWIANRVIGAAIEVHRALGPGLLESAYRDCLAHELSLAGLSWVKEQPLAVDYKGLLIESAYRADLIVQGLVIVELKTVDRLEPVHRAQLLTYLKWSGVRLGLLINFNVPVLRQGIQRVVNQL